MKILVIGSGGREHAVVWKLAQSHRVRKIFCAPGNPGIGQLATNIPIRVTDVDSLLQFAKKEKIDLTMVGPEAPLLVGIVDAFQKEGLRIVGPTKAAAQIEGSKIFAKNLLKKYHIPTASFASFEKAPDAVAYIRTQQFPLVIKADGPALGKGVAVCQTKKEAQTFIRELMEDNVFGAAGSRIIVEDCLLGPEVSFMVATDGQDFVSFLPAQDHKRVFDGNKGPNTGGMGAYAPLPFVDDALIIRIEQEIVMPTLDAMRREGCPYQGILYPGLILTKDGPKVLEFNARFGDPETQVLMMLLQSDLVDILEAIENQTVASLCEKVTWKSGAAACVVLTSKGYPASSEKGVMIKGIELISSQQDLVVFHSATKETGGTIMTDGGRVVAVTAYGNTLPNALRTVYAAIGSTGIHFSGMHFRSDIAAFSREGPTT